MLNYRFQQARFVAASSDSKRFPRLMFGPKSMPEMALVGRSNVGKSSLINDLTQQRQLARTSSTPGKTKEVAFFVVDEKLALVDLPGYGYAKASKDEKKVWVSAIDDYLSQRQELKLLLFILDIRREPSEADLQMLEWAKQVCKPLIVVLNKVDKLKKNEVAKVSRDLLSALGASAFPYVLYSASDHVGRSELIHLINLNIDA
jgi:GTP-binding protein